MAALFASPRVFFCPEALAEGQKKTRGEAKSGPPFLARGTNITFPTAELKTRFFLSKIIITSNKANTKRELNVTVGRYIDLLLFSKGSMRR